MDDPDAGLTADVCGAVLQEFEQRVAGQSVGAAWPDVVRAFDLVDGARRSVRRRRTVVKGPAPEPTWAEILHFGTADLPPEVLARLHHTAPPSRTSITWVADPASARIEPDAGRPAASVSSELAACLASFLDDRVGLGQELVIRIAEDGMSVAVEVERAASDMDKSR